MPLYAVFSSCRRVIAAGVLLTLFLCLCPGDSPAGTSRPAGWKEILNAESATLEDRRALVAKAKRVFLADIRPALVKAGFSSVDEFLNNYYAGSDSDKTVPNDTSKIAEILWAFYPFPELQQTLYDGLLQTGISQELRRKRFSGTVKDLLNCLSSLATESLNNHNELRSLIYVMQYWQEGGYSRKDNNTGKNIQVSGADKALHAEKLAFAGVWLPHMLAGYDEDAPAAHLEAMEKLGLPAFEPWDGENYEHNKAPAWKSDLKTGHAPFHEALLAMWQNRGQPGFMAEARALLAKKDMVPQQRWKMISMTALYPGRSREEYVFMGAALGGISSMDMCWSGMSRMARYGLSFGGCEGPVFDDEIKERQAAPRVILHEQQGPGITLTVLKNPPDLSSAGPLYLVFEAADAAPEFFDLDKTNSRPVFTRGAFYYMTSGPRLCPLDLADSRHKQLLDWFWEQGAASGQCTLLASQKPESDILADLENWYLMLWESEKNKPELVMTFADGGNFQSFLLPRLKGQAASLLLGSIDSLWFVTLTREGDVIRRAAPEGPLPPLAMDTVRPVLMLSNQSMPELWKADEEESLLRRVDRLRDNYPERGFTRARGAAFLEKTGKEILALYDGLDSEDWPYDTMRELLWQTRGTPLDKKMRTVLLQKGKKEDASKAARKGEEMLKAEKKKGVKRD